MTHARRRYPRLLTASALSVLALTAACRSLNQAPELGNAAVSVYNPLNVNVTIYQVFRTGTRIDSNQRDQLGTVAARDSAVFGIVAGGRGWYDFVLVADSSDYRLAGVSRTYHATNGQVIRWIVTMPTNMTRKDRCYYAPMAMECR